MTQRWCDACEKAGAVLVAHTRADSWTHPMTDEQRLEMRVERAGIRPMYRGARLADLLEPLRERFEEMEGKQGIFLWGPARGGKTYAMAALARSWLEAGDNLTVRIKTWPDMIAEMRDAYRGRVSAEKIISPFVGADLTILDDLGSERDVDREATGFVNETLLRLLENRMSAFKPTCITTNLSPDQVYEIFDDRIKGRIKETMELVYYEYRGRNAAQGGGCGANGGPSVAKDLF